MGAVDTIVLVAYFLTVITVGIAYARRMKSLDIYFAGGKQLPWWIGGVSFLMSYVSALSIVVYAALGYEYGLVSLTLYWTTVPATLVTTWLLARRWRRAGIITPVEFLEARYSPAVRQLFAWSGIPLKVVDEGLKIIAIGIFVSAGMRISPLTAMTAVGVVTLVYTVLGGLWAVVVTDFVQFVLVTSAVLLLLPLTLKSAGGWERFVNSAPQGFFHVLNGPYHWGYLAAFLVLSALSLSGNWSLIQKFYSARSDRECRGVGWLASVLFVMLPPAWILTGMLAQTFIPPGGFDPQTIYARISVRLLPPGLLGLVIAALFAATMSVLSSGYNVIAAVLTVDVHQRLIHPQATQKEMILVGRFLTAGIAVLAWAIAVAVTHFHWTIFDTMVAAFGFFLPPTVLPVLAGLLSRRISSKGAMAAFFIGIGVGATFLVYRWIFNPVDSSAFQASSILTSTFLTALVLVISAYWFPARGEAAERASQFFLRLGRPSAPAPDKGESPAPVAGLVILIMGLVLGITGSGLILGVHSVLTLGTGASFTLIGLGMMKNRVAKSVSGFLHR